MTAWTHVVKDVEEIDLAFHPVVKAEIIKCMISRFWSHKSRSDKQEILKRRFNAAASQSVRSVLGLSECQIDQMRQIEQFFYSACFWVQVVKQDWPQKWPSFIPDLVGASKTSETLCENSMIILKLLSEEVFDFSKGELTQVCMCLWAVCQSSALLQKTRPQTIAEHVLSHHSRSSTILLLDSSPA